MRQYLLYSSTAHFLLLAVLFIATRNSFAPKKTKPYYIDFIGGSRVITMEKAGLKPGPREQEQLQRPGSKQASRAETADDSFSSGGALPKPSVLGGQEKLFEESRREEQAGERGTPLIADTENFPYPWYIAQVREALWNAWTEKMPSAGTLKCSVRFEITRKGAVRGISVENSSGNRLFDSAAAGSVESAAPFPELPEDFYEDRLSVHVEFKAR